MAERVSRSRPRILRSEEQGLVKKTEEFLQKTTSSPCVVFHSTTEDEQPGYRIMPARLQMSSRLHAIKLQINARVEYDSFQQKNDKIILERKCALVKCNVYCVLCILIMLSFVFHP